MCNGDGCVFDEGYSVFFTFKSFNFNSWLLYSHILVIRKLHFISGKKAMGIHSLRLRLREEKLTAQ